MRKPHARSVLKNLPHDKQRAVFEYLGEHSLEETEAWLATEGIETGRTALSQFRAWYPLSAQLHSAANMGEAVKEILAEIPGLNLSADQLSQASQAIFEAKALEAGDAELHVGLRKLRHEDRKLELAALKGEQQERELALQEQKFRRETCRLFLEWFEAEQAKAIASGSGTNAEKISRLGQTMFGEAWAE